MPQKGKITIKPYTKVPARSYMREEIAKNINWKGVFQASECFSDKAWNDSFYLVTGLSLVRPGVGNIRDSLESCPNMT